MHLTMFEKYPVVPWAGKALAPFLVTGALVLSVVAPAFAADPKVDVQPWGPNQVEKFDPTKPPGAKANPDKPGDLPGPPVDEKGNPLIPPGERAFAKADFGSEYTFDTSPPDGNGNVTVTKIDVSSSGKTVIYIPSDAGDQLKEHENGHDELYRAEYEKRAKQKLSQAVNGLVGKKFPSAEKAREAINKALDQSGDGALQQQMETSGDKYDMLTNHGRNDVVDPKTKKPIDTKTGVEMTKAERDLAPRAGQAPSKPDTGRSMGATAPDPARVFFDPMTNKLSFGGDLLVAYTNGPVDPILDRGLFQIDPSIMIGPMDNGAIHLSDTWLRIVDTQTGDLLLNGFILELAYMPATLPGFAGMLQGYLDIPPGYAGGINNAIGSPFLQGMGDASSAGEMTTFWFYADQPLFDQFGNAQIPEFGVTGSLKIAVATPIPALASVLQISFGLTGLLGFRWSRRLRNRKNKI